LQGINNDLWSYTTCTFTHSFYTNDTQAHGQVLELKKKEQRAFIDFITRRLFVLLAIEQGMTYGFRGLAAVAKAATPEGEPDFTFLYYTVPYFVVLRIVWYY
jgi:hypothetical protein